jgi:hydroxyacylglutathione hydrolase
VIHQTIVVGPLQCNCVLLGCEKTKEAVLIDPGDEGPRIVEEVQKNGLTVKYVLHTHAHFDHIAGTADVKASLNPTLCLHKDDLQLYENLPMQGQFFGMKFGAAPEIDKFVQDEEEVIFGEHKLQVIHTPGHSPGSICLKLLGAEEILFSGDTLFRQSIGRSDLWGGDYSKLIRSIKSRLLVLEGDTRVYPGHGPATRIGEEKTKNPFLN